MGVSELILYACPTRELAKEIDEVFIKLADRPTTAQRYPPHCSLTGFFHDDTHAVPVYVQAAEAAVGAAVAANRSVAVEVVALRTEVTWIGLEIRSPDLQALATDFARRVADVPTRVDDIRLKDWLHVSLAYGHQPDEHDELAELITGRVDPLADVGWELRLYERANETWTARGAWPLS